MTSLLKILFIYLGPALLLYAGFSPFTLLMNYDLYFFWQHEGVNSTQKKSVWGKKLTAFPPTPLLFMPAIPQRAGISFSYGS